MKEGSAALDDDEESALRQRVRAAFNAGTLPKRSPTRTWGGPGTDAPCAICGRVVTPEEVEFEMEFEQGPGDLGPRNHCVHQRCFVAWELERQSVAPSGNAPAHLRLPEPSSDGTMAARGRVTEDDGELS
jgi:hypothetical protein